MVRHDGGIYNHKLENLYYKTLQRIGNVEPGLHGSPDYQAALGRFVPKMVINGRSVTGVRLESLENDVATFLTDDGDASCRWSDLSVEHRTFFLAEKNRMDHLAAAKMEYERQRQQMIEESIRAQEAERQRVLAAQQMELDRRNRESEKQQFSDAAEDVVGLAIGAGALYVLFNLLKEGSADQPSKEEVDRINEWARKRSEKEAEEILNRAP